MVIFHSYVSLPEGNEFVRYRVKTCVKTSRDALESNTFQWVVLAEGIPQVGNQQFQRCSCGAIYHSLQWYSHHSTDFPFVEFVHAMNEALDVWRLYLQLHSARWILWFT